MLEKVFYILKPEVLKSNIPGYIRGRIGLFLSTPQWVEFADLRIFS